MSTGDGVVYGSACIKVPVLVREMPEEVASLRSYH